MTTPPPTPPTPQYAAPAPLSPSDERLWATLIHIGGIPLGFISPLVGYLVLKDRSAYVREQSATALNFQLTLLIGWVIGSILTIVLIGGLILLAVGVVSIIFSIIAAIAANKGEHYKYPFAITFVK
ncbi:DUF4870 domain-containing protein [soil metagenome]